MTVRTCSIVGCNRGHRARGWCGTHHERWRRHGSPHYRAMIMGDEPERFWQKVDIRGPDDCWPWRGQVEYWGYGIIRWAGRRDKAHRVAWMLTHGEPIPGHLTIDHVCHNRDPICPAGICAHRSCVNPAHLDLVTSAENSRRGKQWR